MNTVNIYYKELLRIVLLIGIVLQSNYSANQSGDSGWAWLNKAFDLLTLHGTQERPGGKYRSRHLSLGLHSSDTCKDNINYYFQY